MLVSATASAEHHESAKSAAEDVYTPAAMPYACNSLEYCSARSASRSAASSSSGGSALETRKPAYI